MFLHTNRVALFVLVLLALISGQTPASERATDDDRQKIEAIFKILDRQMTGSDDYLDHIADDVILMAHNVPVIKGKADYRKHIEDSRDYGHTSIEHQLLATYSYDDVVIARGRAVGIFQAACEQLPSQCANEPVPFETKNLFVFRRLDSGNIEIWQTIFNMNP